MTTTRAQLQHSLSTLSSWFEQRGLITRISDDFRAFEELLAQQRPYPISEAFHPERGLVRDASNAAFWIGVWDAREQLLATSATLRQQLEGSFASMFRREAAHFVPSPVDLGRSDFFVLGEPEHIGGTVAYHGELWRRKVERPDCRNLGRVTPLLLCSESMLRWDPDYTWSIMTTRSVTRGLHVRSGVPSSLPGLARWRLATGESLHEWLVWSSRQELQRFTSPMILEEWMS